MDPLESKIDEVLDAVARRKPYRGPALSVSPPPERPPERRMDAGGRAPGLPGNSRPPSTEGLRVVRNPRTVEDVVEQLVGPFEIEPSGMLRRHSFYLGEEEIRILREMSTAFQRDQSEIVRGAVRALFLAAGELAERGVLDSPLPDVEIVSPEPSGVRDVARRLLLPEVRRPGRSLVRRTFYLTDEEISYLRRMSGWFNRDYSALLRAAVRGLRAEVRLSGPPAEGEARAVGV